MADSPSWLERLSTTNILIRLVVPCLLVALFLPASVRGMYVTIVLFITMVTVAAIGVHLMIRPARIGSQDSDIYINHTQVDETREDDAMLIYATAAGLIDWTGCAHGPEYREYNGYDSGRDGPDEEDSLDFEDSRGLDGAAEEFD